MMAGSGSGHLLSLADWPVTFPCSAAPRSNSSTSATAASTSTRTFGAGGYTPRDPRAPRTAR